MKVLPKVDESGKFYEDVEIRGNGIIKGVQEHWSVDSDPAVRGYIVGYPIPEGLYSPRLDVDRLKAEFGLESKDWYDGNDPEIAKTYWVEGLTADEIAELTKPNLTESEQIRHEMAEQNAEMWDFILSSVGGA